MLEEIGDVSKVPEFISKVKDKNSGVKLMGFGHRVYKNYDPRAKLMRETCHEVLNELGLHNDRLFKLAIALEKIALEDEYFVSASSTRTSTSTPASCSARSASRWRCSPASSRSRAPSAGSRSGRRSPTRNTRSAAAPALQGRHAADVCRSTRGSSSMLKIS